MSALILGALAPLAAFNQFIVARRADKVPIDPRTLHPVNAQSPAAWLSFADAVEHLGRLGPGYGLGFVLTRAARLTVIDIDHALQHDNTWSPLALELIAALPGAVVEVSQSGEGLHIWCRHPAPPDHSNKNTALRIEAYSCARYIMLGTGAVGTMADQCDALPAVLARYFPPAAPADGDDHVAGPCPEWRGPPDTDEGNAELIRRALASRSVAGMFNV